jgi:predicted Zn-dependent protease
MSGPRRPRAKGLIRLVRQAATVCLGTITTLFVIEIALQVGYAGFVALQARRNLDAIGSGEGEVRILCLGESTTAVAGDDANKMLVPRTAYPAQLEQILNTRQSARKFRVLNQGIMGGTTSATLEQLERTLPSLKPQIIIAMMGIKDTPSEWVPVATPLPAWITSLHSVQLLSWIIEDVRLRQNATPTQITSFADLPLAERTKESGYGNYIRELRPAADQDALESEKTAVYLYHVGRITQAETILRDLIARKGMGYTLLSDIELGEDHFEEAVRLIEEAVARHPEDGFYRIQQAHLYLQHRDFTRAKALLAAAAHDAQAPAAPFADVTLVRQYLQLEQAELALLEERYEDALAAAAAVTGDMDRHYREVLPRMDVMLASIRGRAFIGKKDWPSAERELLQALSRDPLRHVNMWLLSSVYRATGQTDKEEQLRRQLVNQTGRVAEYFELAKLFRLTGQADRVPEVLAEAVRNTPSLKENHARLYALAERNGIQLVIMQYPGFELASVYPYAPPKDGVLFVDNQHVFDADPDAYFFQPTYPQSFTHYTKAGAHVLAEHIADTLLQHYNLNGE